MLTINNTLDGYLKDVEIKGNTIQDIENLADIRSVGDKVEGQELYEIPVLSVGKNLLDYKLFNEGFEVDRRIGSNGGTFSSSGYKASKLIEIPRELKGKTLCQNWYGCFATYSSKSETSVISRRFNTELIVIEDNAKYFRIDFPNFNENKLQLEEGTVATSYEPYQEDKLTILSPVQLEKVGNVRDRIICKDGVWGVEKNIIDISLKGLNEYPYVTRNQPTDTSLYRVSLNIGQIAQKGKPLICNRFINDTSTYEKELVSVHSVDGNLDIVISKTKASDTTTLNTWLQQNNLLIKAQATTPQFIPLPHDQQVKLRTFANKTNISFGCEIEGTIKAQVPKSLGATVNTHTEQISNLNKELDRVKKLEESTVSTVETESDFTTVEATSNGYFEDVKLEGKTLVNCLNVEPNVYTTSLHKSEIVNGYHKLTMLADGDLQWDLAKTNNLNLFKPSTYYTFIVDVKTNTTQSTEGIRANTSLNSIFTNGGQSNSYIMLSPINQTGVFVYKYKSEPNFTSNNIRLKMANAKSGGVLEYRMVILEGDYTQNPPSFFEGLKSAGDGADEIVVSSVKGDGNLFDEKEFVKYINTCDSSVKQFTENNKRVIQFNNTLTHDKPFMRNNFKPNTKYTFSMECKTITGSMVFLVCLYTDGTTGIIGSTSSTTYATIQGSSDASKTIEYMYISYGSGGGCAVVLDNFLVKQGMSTTYEPLKQDKKRLLFYNNETQTWEKPILRQWDSIEKHSDGKYYYHQRSAEVVLNGSENWELQSDTAWETDTHISFYYYIANMRRNFWGTESVSICDRFNTITANNSNYTDSNEFSSTDSYKLNIKILKSKLSTQDVAGFKAWLQANNVTVVYQLAQEKVYECTNIDLITYANETNYIVESGAIVPRTTLKVHNNISNVVSLLQKKVSLLESNMTKYMITQNRMQLAST